MAEAVFGLALGKLADFFTKEATLIAGLDDDIKYLLDNRELLLPLLRDVDQRRRKMGSGSLRVWLRKIRQVAHDIERLVDQFHCKLETERAMRGARRLVALPAKVSSWRKLGNRIRRIKKKLNNILADKDKYNVDCCTISSRDSPTERSYRRYNYYKEEHSGVGHNEDVETLTQWLIESTTYNVVSIVGMPGSGKSVLANILFQNEKIRNHFQCYGRIFVSQDYAMRELLEGFMKDAKLLADEVMKEMTQQDMANALLEHLKKKRYLVIIDDLWDKEAWDILRSFLPEGLHGCKIVLTTRNRDIASYADSSSLIHEMRLLNSEESWELFCSKAFPNSSCPSHLEALGKEIVARCDGLPLPIVTLGKLLRGMETTYNNWLKVLKHIQIGFQTGHISFQYEAYQHIQRSLVLSYDDLPYELQLCFLYFAAFPEGDVVDALRIIRLWISEELIAKRAGLTLEEVAEDYLDDLIQRSMILVNEKTDYGSVKSVCVHNLFLDLARAEADDLNFLTTQRGTDIISTHHDRLALHGGFDDGMYNSLHSGCSKLCSLLCISRQKDHLAFPKWEYLKVVEFWGIAVEKLPDDIGNMIYLTYLGLRNTGLNQLPNSIRNLGRLKTIDLLGTGVWTIEDTFWNIPTLRHVLFAKNKFLGTPKLVSPLKDLETLVGLRSGSWVRDLSNAQNIRQLELEGVSEKDKNDLVYALEKLESLVSLELEGEAIPAGVFSFVNRPTLRSLKLIGKVKQLQLQPSANSALLLNLGALSLFETEIGPEDMKIIAALPSLLSLRLYTKSYAGKHLLCPTGSFPRLEVLHLDDLQELEVWEVEEGAMCNLRSLIIFNCISLIMLPGGLRSMTKLENLKLSLSRMPDNITHRVKNEDGEDYEKIKHIKFVEFA